ncbi:MAG: hypothetical protein RBU21_20000 [FCB group bacterium]|jgi:hypothetical protein|nr:hypothetical protein [FCB group bacterium]
MSRLLPFSLILLLASSGCTNFHAFPSAVAPPVVTTAPPAAPAVTVPRPATVQDLAAGIVEALARGDVAQARQYYLSDAEFDSLFMWSGADPRPERNELIDAALQDAVPALSGATFKGIAGALPKAIDFPQGRQIGNLLLERPTSALDAVPAVVDVNGQQRVVRLEGPILVNNYWRLFPPTLAVR